MLPNSVDLIKNEFGFDENSIVKNCAVLFNLTVSGGLEVPQERVIGSHEPIERRFILPNSDGEVIAQAAFTENWVSRDMVEYKDILLLNGEGKEIADFGGCLVDFAEKGGDKGASYFVVQGGGGSIGFSFHDNLIEMTGAREPKEDGMLRELPPRESIDLSRLKGTPSSLVTVKEDDGARTAEVRIDYTYRLPGMERPACEAYQVSFDDAGFMKVDARDHIIGDEEYGARTRTVYLEDGGKAVMEFLWSGSTEPREDGSKERLETITVNPHPGGGADKVFFFDEKSRFEGIGYNMDKDFNFQSADIAVKKGDSPDGYLFERYDTSSFESRGNIKSAMSGERLMEGTMKLGFENGLPQTEITEVSTVKDGYEPDDYKVEKEPEPEKPEKWETSDRPMEAVFLDGLGEFHGDSLHLFDLEGKGGTATYTEYQGFLRQQDVEVTTSAKVDSFTDGNGNKVTLTEDMMLDKNRFIGKDPALGEYPGRGGLFVDIERPGGSTEHYYAGEQGKIYFTIQEDGNVSVGNEKYRTIGDACAANGENRDTDANMKIQDFSKGVKGIEMARLSDLGLGLIGAANEKKEATPMEKLVDDISGTQTSRTDIDYIKLEKGLNKEMLSLGAVSPENRDLLLSAAPKIVSAIREKGGLDMLREGAFLTGEEKAAIRDAMVDRHVYMNCFQTAKGDMTDDRARACVGFDMAAAKIRYTVDTLGVFVGKEIGRTLEGTGATVKDVLDAARDKKELTGPMAKVEALAGFYAEVKQAASEAVPAIKAAAGVDFRGGAYMPGVSESSVPRTNEGAAGSLHSRFQVEYLNRDKEKIDEGGKLVSGFKSAFLQAVETCSEKMGEQLDGRFTDFCSDLKGMGYSIRDNCILSPIGMDRNGHAHFMEGAVETVTRMRDVGISYKTNPNYVEFNDDRKIIDPKHELGYSEYSSAIVTLGNLNTYESQEPDHRRVMAVIEGGMLPSNSGPVEEDAKDVSPLGILQEIDSVIAYNTDFDRYSSVDKDTMDFLDDFARETGKDRADSAGDAVDTGSGRDGTVRDGGDPRQKAGIQASAQQPPVQDVKMSRYSIYDKNDMHAMERIGRTVTWRADMAGVSRDAYTDRMEHHIEKRNQILEDSPFMPYYRQDTFFSYHEWRGMANARVSGVAINGHIPTRFDSYMAFRKFANTSIVATGITRLFRNIADRTDKDRAYRRYHDIYKKEDRVDKNGKLLHKDGIARDKEGNLVVIARITDPVQRRYLGLPPLDEKGRPVNDTGIPERERISRDDDPDHIEKNREKLPHRPADSVKDAFDTGEKNSMPDTEKKGLGPGAKTAAATFLVAALCALPYGGKTEAKDIDVSPRTESVREIEASGRNMESAAFSEEDKKDPESRAEKDLPDKEEQKKEDPEGKQDQEKKEKGYGRDDGKNVEKAEEENGRPEDVEAKEDAEEDSVEPGREEGQPEDVEAREEAEEDGVEADKEEDQPEDVEANEDAGEDGVEADKEEDQPEDVEADEDADKDGVEADKEEDQPEDVEANEDADKDDVEADKEEDQPEDVETDEDAEEDSVEADKEEDQPEDVETREDAEEDDVEAKEDTGEDSPEGIGDREEDRTDGQADEGEGQEAGDMETIEEGTDPAVPSEEKDRDDDSDVLVAAASAVQEKENDLSEEEPDGKDSTEASGPDPEAAVEPGQDTGDGDAATTEEANTGQPGEAAPVQEIEHAAAEAVEQGSTSEGAEREPDAREMATGDEEDEDDARDRSVDAVVDAFSDFLDSMGETGDTFSDFLGQPFLMDDAAQPVTVAEAIGTMMADGNSPVQMMEEALAWHIAGIDITADNSPEALMQASSVGIDLTSIGANDDSGYIDPMQSLETITSQSGPEVADHIYNTASDFMEAGLWQQDLAQDSLGLESMDFGWAYALQDDDIFEPGFAQEIYGQMYGMEPVQDQLMDLEYNGFDMTDELQRMNETTQQMEEEARMNVPEISIDIPGYGPDTDIPDNGPDIETGWEDPYEKDYDPVG